MKWLDDLKARFAKDPRATADAAICALFGPLLKAQDAYQLQHGRYWRGLCTHHVVPGADAACDGATDAAPGEPDWLLFLPEFPAALPVQLQSYPYNGGVCLLARVLHQGQVWVKCLNLRGPEAHRTCDWTPESLA